ncbi:hypothetical protein ALC62_13660 [Cyphomyrmex costatus]|uniref:DNA-directed DNA polymerase n=1 Tax=Cyphomyrmex costatus TaxID=456900 RepID=A0A151I9Y3_9HYME|nr:hypothetical protein ALC62_13660 [Cyphomyrmex costatus]
MELDLIQQAAQLNIREEYVAWEQRCDEFIESLEEQSRIKCPRLSIGNRQAVIASIARLESIKDSVRGRFVYVGAGYGLRWREIETAFESRILTGAGINSNHIDPRRFLEDASEIVLERIQCVLQRYDSIKINTVFNGEFVAGDKRANKSIATRNYEIHRCTDQREWSKHVNLLYVEDDIAGHFVLIKDLSRLVSSQISKKEHKKYFCDSSSSKLELHSTDCGKLNDCAIRLPSEDDKWLKFKNHCRKERVPFVVYADLECALEKMDEDPTSSMYQHHQVFSIAYYIHCSYDDSLSSYRFRRDNNCISWFADELKNLAHSVQSVISTNVRLMDYAHAVNVWQRFSIQTLGEYSDLYLKTDVLLLADVFENFRDSCIASYGLDPAYYYTLPGFTWDAMLKHTGVKFELLTDIDMVMFVERGIRGGLSKCSNRYARANNKYMSSYDSSKPSSYLIGWAMCQPLPYADFRWVDDVQNFDFSTIPLDSPTGYILEVDIEYPQHLHDAHTDLPFCPTREKPPGKRDDKLLATLCDKQRYVIHYRNLQQCTRHGLRIAKIHRILQFTQSPWLRDYIELNTKFRTLAKNDFEKNLYKLMNNAVFGKTMENVRDRVDVKLVTKWEGRYGAEAMIAKPNFHSRSVFSENLVAIELRKLEGKFDKPIYVGMCILDISKTCLYEFHHEYMAPLFHDKCKIMYTDTDSLIYHVECDDVYEIIKRDIDRFDTSDYSIDNPYSIPLANKKVPGLMKDENNGAIMTEFVGLRAKMYALRVQGKKDTKKAKGVKSNVVARSITFDDYTKCMNDVIEMTRRQSCIRSKLHEVYTISETKIALSPYDDKRYIVSGSTDTLPWGHYRCK